MEGAIELPTEEWRKGRVRLNRTVAALIDRGVDHKLAERLCREGLTLSALKQHKLAELRSLGLPDHVAKAIQSEQRPPIPFTNLARVLIANRFTCCICHDTQRPVVIHHITDWVKSRTHSPSNLAVLCLDHHNEAHKRGGHTQNLTPDIVRQAKCNWEHEVAKLDTRAILDASAVASDSWWLFNHVRLFKLATDLGIELSKVDAYMAARGCNLVDDIGLLRPRDRKTHWMYEGGDGIPLHHYVTGVLRAVLEQLTVYNISNDLDRSILASVIRLGDFLFLQGSFDFKNQTNAKKGPGQTFTGVRRANKVEVSFTADRWEATANSAWHNWLKGRHDVGCVLRVMDVKHEAGVLRIGTTAIAIGAALEGLKTREYANTPYRQGYIFSVDDEADRDEDEFAF